MQILVKDFNNSTFVLNINNSERLKLLDLKNIISNRLDGFPVEKFQIVKSCCYIESKYPLDEYIDTIGFQNNCNIEIRPKFLL